MTDNQKSMTGAFRFSVFVLFLFLCLWFAACGLRPSSAAAQDITFQANVNSTTVPLGSYVRLTLTATGVQGLDPVNLPEIDGFESDYIGPSSRVSIVNGKHSSSYAFVYDLFPKKTGEFVVPAVTINIKGSDYTTDPIRIRVIDQEAASASGDEALSAAASLQDRLFVTLETTKKNLYVNEEVPVIIRLYVGGISVRNVEMPVLEHSGFFMDEFSEPRQYVKVVNGIHYNVVEFTASAYPTRSGPLELGPVKERCNIVFKDAGRPRRSRGLFDDEFFSNFFDTYTARPVSVQSEPRILDVNPLPEEGKPDNFSGAVGKFSFNMDASPKEVKVGDPVTVRMKVSGSGSLKIFDLKGFESDQSFRVYDQDSREEGTARILEQVLIPLHENADQIPEVHFSFFDPEKAQYRTISRGPVQLTVHPLAKDEEFAVVGLQEQADGMFIRKDRLGQDINFIKDRLGRVYHRGYRVNRSSLFIMLCVIVFGGWLSGFFYYRFTSKLRTDERFARRLQAPRYARSGLKSAKKCLEQRDAAGFYDELFTTLQKYFSHKFHIAPGAVSLNAILGELNKRGKAADAVSDKVRQVLEQCEAVRYASAGSGHDEMSRAHQTAQEIIDWFERKF